MSRLTLAPIWLALWFSTASAAGSAPAFPGAAGFGAMTTAGRGGQVVRVTNLHDSGAGSLREAVSGTRGARIVVFEVSGAIQLKSPLVIREPYLTVAGQTAPSPGITLADFGVRIHTHDILLQHLFIRLDPRQAAGGGDGIAIKVNTARDDPFNIVIDHCSISWANDENLSIFTGYGNLRERNVTVSNCLLAEGHYGLLLAQGSRGISVLRTLVMSARERYPRIAGGCRVNLVNNLFYNSPGTAFTVIGDGREGPDFVTALGNVYLSGPATPADCPAIAVVATAAPGTMIFAPGKGEQANVASTLTRAADARHFTESMPVAVDGLRLLAAGDVESHIIANVGARPAERWTGHGDPVDQRLLAELQARTGSVKDRRRPEWHPPRSASRDFTPFMPSRPKADDDRDGFTDIEGTLEQMAAGLEGRQALLPAPPRFLGAERKPAAKQE